MSNLLLGPVLSVRSLSNCSFGTKDVKMEKDTPVADRFARMKQNYVKEGMRKCVEGILLEKDHNHSHILMLQIGNTFCKLPGGRLKLGEDEIVGLKRKLAGKLAPASASAAPDWKKDDVHVKRFMSLSEAEHPRSVVEDDRLLLTNVTVPTTFSGSRTQGESNATFQLGIASAAAIALTFLACSRAWAEPEIASIQDAASWWGDVDDIKSGFVSAFLLIFFSEIGDKTFFIAAVLASRKSNVAVFTGTFGALVAMTFISVFLGRTFHYIDGILPFSLGENDLPLDDLAAVVLLVYFGATTLLEAASIEGSKAQEEQQEAELAIAGLGGNGKGSAITNTALATFGLVFVAEWGDKSFFSTVALSAASSPVGVVLGAVAGHGIATLVAVLGGSFLSNYISEKVTAYIGGSLFLIFAAFTLYEIVSVRS